MMEPFPEEWELLSFFEAEPKIMDRGVPWYYNQLVFETTRGDDHIRCVIEPGYEILKIVWWRGKQEAVSIDLHSVQSLRIITGQGRDCLIANFRSSEILPMEFQLKPTICLRWGISEPH